MNRAREAIGAVQCEPSLAGTSADASAHNERPGVNLADEMRAGKACMRSTPEPLGAGAEKLQPKKFGAWSDLGRECREWWLSRSGRCELCGAGHSDLCRKDLPEKLAAEKLRGLE